jgi:hypothetical protein
VSGDNRMARAGGGRTDGFDVAALVALCLQLLDSLVDASLNACQELLGPLFHPSWLGEDFSGQSGSAWGCQVGGLGEGVGGGVGPPSDVLCSNSSWCEASTLANSSKTMNREDVVPQSMDLFDFAHEHFACFPSKPGGPPRIPRGSTHPTNWGMVSRWNTGVIEFKASTGLPCRLRVVTTSVSGER